jgi:glutamine amidotransferase PdxT
LFTTGIKVSRTSREKHRLRVYRNRVLRRIFGPQREDVNKGVEKTAYEKLHDLYCSPNIIRMIKSRRIRWMQHVACMVEKKKYTSFHWEKTKG